jgi:hypothetical protein
LRIWKQSLIRTGAMVPVGSSQKAIARMVVSAIDIQASSRSRLGFLSGLLFMRKGVEFDRSTFSNPDSASVQANRLFRSSSVQDCPSSDFSVKL